jgi:hypothetical protein
MNDYGHQYPQQFAPAGPPARPPMPGPAAQGRPMPRPQYPARPAYPQQAPMPQGPMAQGPMAQGPPPPWPAPPAPLDEPAAAPARKRGKAGRIIGVLVVAAALGGVGWVVATGSPQPVTAAVGECVTQTGTDALAVVGCGDPAAQFTVAGKLENKTAVDASLFACTDFPAATSSYWQGVEGKPGTVLCLAPLKPAAPPAP